MDNTPMPQSKTQAKEQPNGAERTQSSTTIEKESQYRIRTMRDDLVAIAKENKLSEGRLVSLAKTGFEKDELSKGKKLEKAGAKLGGFVKVLSRIKVDQRFVYGLFIIAGLGIFTAGGYYLYDIYRTASVNPPVIVKPPVQQPPARPQPKIEPLEQASLSFISVEEAIERVAKLEDIPNKLVQLAQSVTQQARPLKRYIFTTVKDNKETEFSPQEFLQGMSIFMPEAIITRLQAEYNFYLYKQEGGVARSVLAMKIAEPTLVRAEMRNWEPKLFDSLWPAFYPGALPGLPFTDEYQDNVYRGVPIRYLNFPAPTLTVDYAILDDEKILVFTTSKDSIFAVIDELKDNSNLGEYNNETPEPDGNNFSVGDVENEVWLVLSNPEFNYEVRYPESWTMKKSQEKSSNSYSFEPPGLASVENTTILVSAIALPGPESEWQTYTSFEGLVNSGLVTRKSEIYQGRPAFRYTSSSKRESSTSIKFDSLAFYDESRFIIYEISFATDETDEQKKNYYNAVYQEMLRTFRLLPQDLQ